MATTAPAVHTDQSHESLKRDRMCWKSLKLVSSDGDIEHRRCHCGEVLSRSASFPEEERIDAAYNKRIDAERRRYARDDARRDREAAENGGSRFTARDLGIEGDE